jgi:hypothetical protein
MRTRTIGGKVTLGFEDRVVNVAGKSNDLLRGLGGVCVDGVETN